MEFLTGLLPVTWYTYLINEVVLETEEHVQESRLHTVAVVTIAIEIIIQHVADSNITVDT